MKNVKTHHHKNQGTHIKARGEPRVKVGPQSTGEATRKEILTHAEILVASRHCMAVIDLQHLETRFNRTHGPFRLLHCACGTLYKVLFLSLFLVLGTTWYLLNQIVKSAPIWLCCSSFWSQTEPHRKFGRKWDAFKAGLAIFFSLSHKHLEFLCYCWVLHKDKMLDAD